MAFETLTEKFVLASVVVLALIVAELSTGFISHMFQPPAPKEKISASNYPNYIVREEIPSEKLVLTYNPELAIVSPDRTPFIDIVLKIKNEQDVPRTLKLVFPDPATLLTDDPRFVVAHTTFKDENTDQTYHRLVLFLPEKAEKEVKIRYENAYAALDDLKHDVTLELYNEDDQKVADITYRLRSVVLSFWDVWTLPTMPVSKKEILLWTGNPSFNLKGEFIYWVGGSDDWYWRCRSYVAEVPLGSYTGKVEFTVRTGKSNASNAKISYFNVKVLENKRWRTLLSCSWIGGNSTCPTNWKKYKYQVQGAERIRFETQLCGYHYNTAWVRVKDLRFERSAGWLEAYYKTADKPISSSVQTVEGLVDVPDGKYRGFLIQLWSDFDGDVCAWDYIKVEVYDGTNWITKTNIDPGDFCGAYRGVAKQPVWIDTSNMDSVTQLRITWRARAPCCSTKYLHAKVYMVPYKFPNNIFFEEVCDQNTSHTLQLQTDGEFGVLQFPDNSCTSLKKQAVSTVHIRATYESQQTDLNLPVFYDPEKSDDLLWRMYGQWRNSLEVNIQ